MRISDWSSDVCSSDLVESVRRLAEGQIGNFQGRLERLHGARGGTEGFDNGLSVMIDRACDEDDWQVVGSTCPRPLRDEQAAVRAPRSEEHTSELQSIMRISYAVIWLKKKK